MLHVGGFGLVVTKHYGYIVLGGLNSDFVTKCTKFDDPKSIMAEFHFSKSKKAYNEPLKKPRKQKRKKSKKWFCACQI